MLIGARNAILAGGGSQPSGGVEPLCFSVIDRGGGASHYITLGMQASNASAPAVDLLYSTDKQNWLPFSVGTTSIDLYVNDRVWFKAGQSGNTSLASSNANYNKFTESGHYTLRLEASGNTNSLLDGEQEIDAVGAYAFAHLFEGMKSLMYSPELPAINLAKSCYRDMFSGCDELRTSPSLPASTLATRCYQNMFYGCELLKSIRVNFTTWVTVNTFAWVDGVAASGTFYCPTALGTNSTITRGGSACPEGWTVINTDA